MPKTEKTTDDHRLDTLGYYRLDINELQSIVVEQYRYPAYDFEAVYHSAAGIRQLEFSFSTDFDRNKYNRTRFA